MLAELPLELIILLHEYPCHLHEAQKGVYGEYGQFVFPIQPCFYAVQL